jgi:hypothetical protein
MYVGRYNSTAEIFTVVGKRQTLDYSSSGYVWATAGSNGPDPDADADRLLTVAWVRGGGNARLACVPDGCPSVVSLVRSISWDAKTKQLVSFPVVEYETLRNETYLEGKDLGTLLPAAAEPSSGSVLAPSAAEEGEDAEEEVVPVTAATAVSAVGSSKSLSVPTGVGSVDILVSFALGNSTTTGISARNFGVSVRSGTVGVEILEVSAATSGGGYSVVVGFKAGPQPCVSIRGQPPCTTPPTVSHRHYRYA